MSIARELQSVVSSTSMIRYGNLGLKPS